LFAARKIIKNRGEFGDADGTRDDTALILYSLTTAKNNNSGSMEDYAANCSQMFS